MKKLKFYTAFLACFLTLLWSSFSYGACADTQAELDALTNADFSVTWRETTANDGKPMLLKMSDRNDQLYFIFEKTREGVWAEGAAQVCEDGDDLIVQMKKKDIKLGANAPGIIKLAMGGGAKFKVEIKSARSIHVSTRGWDGNFVPN